VSVKTTNCNVFLSELLLDLVDDRLNTLDFAATHLSSDCARCRDWLWLVSSLPPLSHGQRSVADILSGV